VKGDDTIWYVIGIFLAILLIRDGVHGVRDRERQYQTYFILSVGQIITGIWVLILLVIIFLKKTWKIF